VKSRVDIQVRRPAHCWEWELEPNGFVVWCDGNAQ
jgi:hypothetical protein